MAGCEECKNEQRISALEKDVERNSNQHREFYNSFKELEKRDAVTGERYGTILSTMAEMKTAIEDMKAKPGKRWESVIAAVITGVVAFVLGLVLRGGA